MTKNEFTGIFRLLGRTNPQTHRIADLTPMESFETNNAYVQAVHFDPVGQEAFRRR